MILHRNIDIIRDKELLLDFHCQINYDFEYSFFK